MVSGLAFNIEEKLAASKELDLLLEESIIDESGRSEIIFDGIVDPHRYWNSTPRILWILKEPYDEADGSGGGWDLRISVLEKNSPSFGRAANTFLPMLYASWSILNGYPLWDDMPDVEDDPKMLNALKTIAYINVKKLPGLTTSNGKIIAAAYSKYKRLLLRQIDCYEPNVIVGGSTLGHFLPDFGITHDHMIKRNSLNYVFHSGRLLIDAYHPAQRSYNTGISRKQYCNDIIETVKLILSSNINTNAV